MPEIETSNSSKRSPVELLALLPSKERERFIKRMKPDEAMRFPWDWRNWWARPAQLDPPGDWWHIWLLLAGRGFGKTRVGAEWVRGTAEAGKVEHIALVAPTAGDVRDVMVEGPSGLLEISPDYCRPKYEPSKRRLVWPNGCTATTFSADEPERLRGPQHGAAWCDEMASWRYADAWDNLMFGLREGDNPRVVVTTTPKPVKLIKEMIKQEGKDVVVTRGSTYENQAHLSPRFIATVVRRYEGTRLGRQELNAELLDDVPGALWNRELLERLRVKQIPCEIVRTVVAIDPAATSGENANESGIIVASLGDDGHCYVQGDISGNYQPTEWAKAGIGAYYLHRCDRIVGEINNGGEMIESTLRAVDDKVSYRSVHASHGKYIRAEPVSALYEQGRVHHVGFFAALEDQQCEFTIDFDRKIAGYSPDRLDALVWAITELMMGAGDFQGWLEFMKNQARGERSAEEKEAGVKAKPGMRPVNPAEPDGGDLRAIYDRAIKAANAAMPDGDACRGCGAIIGESDAFVIFNGRWHTACFNKVPH